MAYAYSAVFKVNVKELHGVKNHYSKVITTHPLHSSSQNYTTLVSVLEIDRTMKMLFLLVKTEFKILTSAFLHLKFIL